MKISIILFFVLLFVTSIVCHPPKPEIPLDENHFYPTYEDVNIFFPPPPPAHPAPDAPAQDAPAPDAPTYSAPAQAPSYFPTAVDPSYCNYTFNIKRPIGSFWCQIILLFRWRSRVL
jgi:hypothetical protein